MYLYLLKFSKYPDLVKIGISKSMDTRIKVLKPFHGNCTVIRIYQVGKHTAKLERLLHSVLTPYNVKVDGEGGSEFFNLSDYILIESMISLCNGVDVTDGIHITKRKTRTRMSKVIQMTKQNSLPTMDLKYIERYFYGISKLTVALSFSNMLCSEIT